MALRAVRVDRRQVRERGRVTCRPDAGVGPGHGVLRRVVHELMAGRTVLVVAGDGQYHVRICGGVALGAIGVDRGQVRERGRVTCGANARVGPGHRVLRRVVSERVARRAGLVPRVDRSDHGGHQ